MAVKRKTKSLFSLSTLLASFFGAAMIAGAYAYFNYKFAEYKFIDFDKWTFYEKKTIFIPHDDEYIVLFYSSKMQNAYKVLHDINASLPILAVDFYQQTFPSTSKIHYVRAGTNTLLKVIQRFNIYEVPSIFIIKRTHKTLYKQDSMIHKLKKIENFQNRVKIL